MAAGAASNAEGHDRAVAQLTEATVDHARVLAHAGCVDEACELAMQTLAIARTAGLERVVRRVRDLRAELPPVTREAAALDEALALSH